MADIVAVDPGKTTGWVYWDGEKREIHHFQTSGRFNFYYGFHEWLCAGRDLFSPIIVVEKFVITPSTAKMSQQPDALLITGWLEAESLLREGVFDNTQKPSDAKGFMTDDKLRKLGWWKKPGAAWDHALDAARHLGLYLSRTEPWFNNLLLKGEE